MVWFMKLYILREEAPHYQVFGKYEHFTIPYLSEALSLKRENHIGSEINGF